MDKLMIKGALLIDGSGAAPLVDSLVLVEAGRIVWVGPAVDAPTGLEDYRVLEAAGQSLLPGLIDSHVHLTMDPAPTFMAVAASESVPMATLRAVRNGRLNLEAGVTTVRDMGAKGGAVLDLVKAMAQGLVTGPRVVAAGMSICMTGGHGWFVGREADGPDGVRKAVREQLKAGAACIKFMSTGGVMTPGIEAGVEGLTEVELRAGIEEAHKAGRRTATHGIGTAGINNALRAGIDSVEHGALLDAESLRLLLERKAYLVPTLRAVGQIVRNAEGGQMEEYVTRKARSVYTRHLASFRLAVENGVCIAAGTDAGTPFNHHGGLPYELVDMVEHGFSPQQSIMAGTSIAADLLNLADQIGTVAVGKLADLILVDGNPLDRIDDVLKLRTVIQAGRVVVQKEPARAGAVV